MKVKLIKQIDESITLEFYNSMGEKINYEIEDIQKIGLGFIYKLKGLRISSYKKKR